MNNKCSSTKKEKHKGFTLLELIVVLAGLGILSSLALEGIVKSIDYAKVDEAKTLLNTAAAECLQELRMATEAKKSSVISRPLSGAEDETKKPLPDLLSADKLKRIGYEFNSNYNKCGDTLITAITQTDRANRYPGLGFRITDKGVLIKYAKDEGSDTNSLSQKWAGSNVSKGKELEEWQNHNALISAAKTKCIDEENAWLQKKDPYNQGRYDQAWDDKADSGCPSGPPKVDNAECTWDGCNETIYAYKGIIVSSGKTEKAKQDYFDYIELQKGKDCAQELRNLSEATPPTHTGSEGIAVDKCDGDIYWFHRGKEVSAETWKSNMCSENKQALLNTLHSGPVEHCDISPIYICGGEEILENGDREQAKAFFEKCRTENKDAQCTEALNADALNRAKSGPYTSPTPENMAAPVGKDCGETYWWCPNSGKIYREPGAEEKYKADESCITRSCSEPRYNCKKNKHKSKPECIEYLNCLSNL